MGVTCTTCSASHYFLPDETCTATLPSCPVTTWKMTDATQSTPVVCPACELCMLELVMLSSRAAQARRVATTARPAWAHARRAVSTTILLRAPRARLCCRRARQQRIAAYLPHAQRQSCVHPVCFLFSSRLTDCGSQARPVAATARHRWAPYARCASR